LLRYFFRSNGSDDNRNVIGLATIISIPGLASICTERSGSISIVGLLERSVGESLRQRTQVRTKQRRRRVCAFQMSLHNRSNILVEQIIEETICGGDNKVTILGLCLGDVGVFGWVAAF
jgi:hypothetical protein